MDQFLASITLFASNFAPQGYLFAAGQILSISSNTAVFSLVGTTYGGNGTSTFALPDLRGRAPIGQGQGPGLSNYVLGQAGGTESVTITQDQMPAHSHALNVAAGPGTVLPGTTTYLAAGNITGSGPNATILDMYTPGGTNVGTTALYPGSISTVGGGQPVGILQPYLAISYIFAMTGIFPARN
jgi:microcystin-dependent protein